jgi:hypothetical protein
MIQNQGQVHPARETFGHRFELTGCDADRVEQVIDAVVEKVIGFGQGRDRRTAGLIR